MSEPFGPTGVAGAPADKSQVETTHIVLPPDTNYHGTAFGGRIMQWMDIAAAVCAQRHCAGACVTVAVDELVFSRPMRTGDVVIIKASINHTGRTSVEVGVRVERELAGTRVLEHCLSGYFTFVAVDEGGRPRPVPPLLLTDAVGQRRFAAAEKRRARRLHDRSGGD